MTYYNNFDCKVNCEEISPVSESEYDEVMMLMAQESEAQDGFGDWSESTEKDYLGGYSNSTEGASYNGIDV
jgi:hypothetical protein